MLAALPLPILLAPFLIAGTAVATLIAASRSGSRGLRWRDALGYQPDAATSVSFVAVRYVGGHHALPRPLAKPFMLLTQRHLAVFTRRGGALACQVPWASVSDVSLLDGERMAQATASVRGLAPGALGDPAPDARFLRVRYEDERGWWQNAIWELAPEAAEQQAGEVERIWRLPREVKADSSAA